MTNKKYSEYYADQSPIPFYVLLSLFILSNMLRVVNFTPEVKVIIDDVRVWINAAVILMGPMYFAFTLLLWKKSPWTFFICAGLILTLFALWNYIGQTKEYYTTTGAIFLALLAYKKDYKVVLKIFLIAHLVTLLVGIIGLRIGFTTPRFKRETTDVGVSLGLIYPNHLGRMVYIVMTIAWYLWGQKKKVFATISFWAMAVVMWFYVECKTIAIFMVVFPICWWLCCVLEGRKILKPVKWLWNMILIIMPFLCFAFTYWAGKHRGWMMNNFEYGTGIYALMMRFISAGIFFDIYGFPLFGRNITDMIAPFEWREGHEYTANVVDNAYIYYLIALGLIVLIALMIWLCFATYRMIRNKDHALVLMAVFFCGYGLIEVGYFQFEHNFLMFYPLTVAALMYKKKEEVNTSLEDNFEEKSEGPALSITGES